MHTLRRPLLAARCCLCTLTSATSLLPSTPLPYRGVLVDVAAAGRDEIAAASFEARLASSLDAWRDLGLKSCMLRVPIERAGLAEHAASQGFVFHHAEGRHAVLKRWLQPALEDKVPPFATHQVGVAGLVIHERRILLVKEWRDVAGKDGAAATRVPSAQWKLPGGLLERGESFGDAVAREVFEETGVQTKFRSVLSFWHRHGLVWGQSDLYYVARLEVVGPDTDPTPQPDEISDVTWMEVDDFLATQDHPLIRAVLARSYGLTDAASSSTTTTTATTTSGRTLSPLVEMAESPVQWPGRQPYPTYFGAAGED